MRVRGRALSGNPFSRTTNRSYGLPIVLSVKGPEIYLHQTSTALQIHQVRYARLRTYVVAESQTHVLAMGARTASVFNLIHADGA